MKLFPTYQDGIKQILEKRSMLNNSPNVLLNDTIMKGANYPILEGRDLSGQVYRIDNNSKTLFTYDKNQMERLFGRNKAVFPEVSIGTHPDFAHIKHEEFVYHHCISMFVDIKGSTKLASKYTLPEIRRIKDTVLTLCIHVVNFFGGHVHRLQGDAVFIQFVRTDLHPNDSIINALNTASVLCNFISTDLAKEFEANGVEPLKIRVGIDYGRENEVLWSHYGIPQCSELTTTSLHTDLAAKLQAQAENNEIRIGKNVKEALDLPDDLWSYAWTKDSNGQDIKDYYIFQNNGFQYNKYIFNWKKYLKTYDFIDTDTNGKDLTVNEKSIKLVCFAHNEDNSINYEYKQNLESLPKGLSLKYHLRENGHPYFKKNYETIKWKIVNRGAEAKSNNFLESPEQLETKTNPIFETSSAYLGHHFLECRIYSPHSQTRLFKFPIFVQ